MKVYKAYAKVNIFLKITGLRDNYHEIISRFMKVDTLYDELYFASKEDCGGKTEAFVIKGDFACDVYQNTIYKAYFALKKATESEKLEQLMRTHGVCVQKNIPAFAGLGGGSSDAATYLKMCNEVLHLGLSLNELAVIGLEVGADVPFFIYGYNSANVSGIGERVVEFNEESLAFEVFTPKVEISTPKVYQKYRSTFYAPITEAESVRLQRALSIDILTSMDADEANDLFVPAKDEYTQLILHHKKGWHFSGSGSSFFRVIQG
ncbi:4-(cytidine 5'-diphospho)-2-C-methyl-D-erythritol kinase [Sulfurimonas sp. SAG-AH-194-I05]|nr:4-(cytidine 5'-diphospho)-2-C-methyl-D-erythritol kinase [Sulfurimonas sp. SAG-AH-194-I05]MDF1874926.1 4-(cytidine 5'-diphospho)-2-C-methyl-D-erythritol kinase [Sulfurimonas sp. SAG-AH-194-I05]